MNHSMPVDPKMPKFSPISINAADVDGIDAYDIDDNIMIHVKGKITRIERGDGYSGEDSKKLRYCVHPKEMKVMHSPEMENKTRMMGKGVSKETYEKAHKPEAYR